MGINAICDKCGKQADWHSLRHYESGIEGIGIKVVIEDNGKLSDTIICNDCVAKVLQMNNE